MRENKKKIKKEQSPFVRICMLQFIMCGLIFLIIFISAKINVPLYEEIKNSLTSMFSEDIDMGGYFSSFVFPGSEETLHKVKSTAAKIKEEKQEENNVEISDDMTVDCAAFSFYEHEIIMPAKGVISSDYGMRVHPIYKTENFHGGRDIASDEGSNIYAVMDGTVISAGQAQMAGNYIKLEHEGDIETMYCHCSRLFVKEGEKVRKGDIIALMGHTGMATGPHLHFEYRVGSERKNPALILDKASCVH